MNKTLNKINEKMEALLLFDVLQLLVRFNLFSEHCFTCAIQMGKQQLKDLANHGFISYPKSGLFGLSYEITEQYFHFA